MSASSRPERRKKSSLVGEHPAWAAEPPSERPDAVPAPPLAAVPVRSQQDEERRLAEAKGRTDVRDASWGWAAATNRLRRRTGEWEAAMVRSRELGTAPGVLREMIAEAVAQAGVGEDAVPAKVWRAAGLKPPLA